jgi:hypothetical protein
MQNTPTIPPPKNINPLGELLPPDEKFWKRYSPHNEAPLSGVSSFALHVLAIPLLLLVAFVVSKIKDDDENRSLPVDVVRVKFSGGGGSPKGIGSGPGGLDATENKQEQGSTERPSEQKPAPEDPPKAPSVASQERLKTEFNNDPNIKRLFLKGTQASARLFDLDRDVREKLRQNVNSGPGRGQGGAGRDGGKDTGKDKGVGAAEGAGPGALNQREKRQLRWAMTFSTQNGNDYLDQLHGLGAIVAIPHGGGEFLVIHNLRKPREAKVEDITKFNRIYWVDNKPQSVMSLAMALRLPEAPPFFAAFFPKELERKLLDRELAYLNRRHPGKVEDDIHETKFDVVRRGGSYDVSVRELTLQP